MFVVVDVVDGAVVDVVMVDTVIVMAIAIATVIVVLVVVDVVVVVVVLVVVYSKYGIEYWYYGIWNRDAKTIVTQVVDSKSARTKNDRIESINPSIHPFSERVSE